MGGYGSGNWFQSGKITTDEMREIDVRYLQREGLLKSKQLHTLTWSRQGKPIASIKILAGDSYIRLIYKSRKNGGDWENKDYYVAIEKTPCHYGGNRVWFNCPHCHRRVAKLYGGMAFACRHCHDLGYKCQRESDLDRLARKADKVRERLDWDLGILNGRGWKPKGMHWKTFDRLTAKHNKIERALLSGIMAQIQPK